MLGHSQFEFERPMTGLEIELSLVNGDLGPKLDNKTILEQIADPDYQTELARFNIELNVRPRPLPGDAALELEQDLRASLNHASERAAELNTGIVAIGILPTVMPEHFEGDWISENYEALNTAVLDARGEDVWPGVEGSDRGAHRALLDSFARSRRARRCSCTCRWSPSALRTTGTPPSPRRSPARRGRELALLPRPAALGGDPHPVVHPVDGHPLRRAGEPGVRPRSGSASGGSRRSSTCSRRTCATSRPCCRRSRRRNPEDVFERGEVPELKELRLHNGTVYRWNRPIYDIVQADRTCGWRTGGRLRARASSTSWPTPPSTTGIGCVVLDLEDRPVWTR